MPASNEPYGITRQEAARLLATHYNTIRRMEASGILRSRRIMHGRQEEVRLHAGDVQAERERRMSMREAPQAENEVERLRIENEALRAEIARDQERIEKLLDTVIRLSERGVE